VRRSRDFQRISRQGARVRSRDFVVLAAVAPGGRARRLGVTVSRKVGGAVVRNRVKRRIREWFRADRKGIPEGIDIVVIARPGAAELSGDETREQLAGLRERLAERSA